MQLCDIGRVFDVCFALETAVSPFVGIGIVSLLVLLMPLQIGEYLEV